MIRRIVIMAALVLVVGPANADGHDLGAVSSLKVDLDAVVELGTVRPVDGITAAGQPDAAALEVFARQGYAAVIDLRTEGEDRGLDEKAVVEGLGMEYVVLPITRDDINFDSAKELDRLLSRYDEPVLVHCASSNRVGALLALRLYQATGDAELALEMGRAGGLTSLEGTVKEVLGVD